MSTTSRGYGAAHQRARARWAPVVATGSVACARCHELIDPGDLWDLDHTEDRSSYNGPAHASCNRSAGGHKGNRLRRRRANPTSRAW